MSSCDALRLEAWLDDALEPSASAELVSHLEACLGCARELSALRKERALFAQRALAGSPPVPAFEAVLAAARAPRPHRATRNAPAWIAAAASVAAVVLIAVGTLPRPVSAAGGACYLSDGESAPSVELAEATEDARFGACLLASPVPGDRCL